MSDLSDEFDFQPSLLRLWVNQVLEQAEKGFGRPKGPKSEDDEAEAGKSIATLLQRSGHALD